MTTNLSCRRWFAGMLEAGLDCDVFDAAHVIAHITPDILARRLPPAVLSELLAASLAAREVSASQIVATLTPARLAEYAPLELLWACFETGARAADLVDAEAAAGSHSQGRGRFLRLALDGGIDASLVTSEDLLRHCPFEMLTAVVPQPLIATLLTESLTAGAMSAELVVKVLGTDSLAVHVPMGALWRCVADVSGRELGQTAAAAPVVATARAEPTSVAVEAKAVEAKAAEAKAVEAKAVEAKAAEAKAVEAKAVEAKAVEAKAVEAKAAEAKAVEAKAVEAKAVEAKAAEAKAAEAKAAEAKAAEAKAAEAKAAEAKAAEAKAVEAKAAEAKAAEAKAAEAKAVEAKAAEAKAAEAKAEPAKSERVATAPGISPEAQTPAKSIGEVTPVKPKSRTFARTVSRARPSGKQVSASKPERTRRPTQATQPPPLAPAPVRTDRLPTVTQTEPLEWQSDEVTAAVEVELPQPPAHRPTGAPRRGPPAPPPGRGVGDPVQ